MSKKILHIDLDDTILCLVSRWLEVYNETYNDDLTYDEITDWEITKFTKISKEEMLSIPIQDKFYQSLKIRNGAYSTIKWAMDYYDVQICTSTHRTMYDSKIKWIENNLPFFPVSKINAIHDKYILHGQILFDDRPKNLDNFFIIKPMLFSTPWNKGCTEYNRVKDWSEFREFLENDLKES